MGACFGNSGPEKSTDPPEVESSNSSEHDQDEFKIMEISVRENQW